MHVIIQQSATVHCSEEKTIDKYEKDNNKKLKRMSESSANSLRRLWVKRGNEVEVRNNTEKTYDLLLKR